MLRIPAERSFRLTVIASKVVTVRARIRVLYDNGTEDDFHPPALTTSSARVNQVSDSEDIMKRPGEVIACHVDFQGAGAKRGQVFAFVHSGGNIPEQMLARGYLFGNGSLNLGQDEGMLSGKGYIRSIDLGDPDANVEYTAQVVPTNTAWVLRGFIGRLVQGATQTPRPTIEITDGMNVVNRLVARRAMAVSSTIDWGLVDGLAFTDTTTLGGVNVASIAGNLDARYPAGYEITFVTVDKGANTNWGTGRLLVEEWLQL